MGGRLVVRVAKDNNQITDFELLTAKETGAYGAEALPTLIEEVKVSNSADVDAVSGATVTANACKGTVQDALAKFQIELKLNTLRQWGQSQLSHLVLLVADFFKL